MIPFQVSATSKSIDIQIVDDTGLPVTGLTYATVTSLVYSLAGANADVTITPVTLSTLTTAWASGGFKERGGGVYRLDLPNAVFTTAGLITIRGEASGQRVIAPKIVVVGYDPLAVALDANLTKALGTAITCATAGIPDVNSKNINNQSPASVTLGGVTNVTNLVIAGGTVAASTSTTITLTSGLGIDNSAVGCNVFVKRNTSDGWQRRTIVGYVDSTKVLTVDRAWDVNPVAASSTYIILPIGCPAIDASGRTTALLASSAVSGLVTAIWQALTASSDFTVSGSIGALLAALSGSGGSTAAAIATAVWQDLLASSDFSTSGSVGKLIKDYLDAAISSRLASGGYSAPPSAAGIATAIFTDLMAGSDFSTAGSFGKLVKDYLDAAVSSRLATGSYTTPPTVAQIATAIFTDLLATSDFSTSGSFGKLVKDYLDVAVSSRLSTAGYTVPPTVAQIATALFTDLLAGSDFSTSGSFGKLVKDYLDAAVSSRPTAAAIVTAAWQSLLASSNFSTAGSVGLLLKTVLNMLNGYQVHTIVDTVTTSGNTAHVKVLLKAWDGQLIDLHTVDSDATCTVSVIRDGNVPQFDLDETDMGVPNDLGVFEATYSNPNFTTDCGYTALTTVVVNGVTYSDRVGVFHVWP